MIKKFELGRTVVTAHASDVAREENIDLAKLLKRHEAGDWGDIDDDDKKVNDLSLKLEDDNRLMLLSSYDVTPNRKIWIITEWDRSSTTILLPEDY